MPLHLGALSIWSSSFARQSAGLTCEPLKRVYSRCMGLKVTQAHQVCSSARSPHRLSACLDSGYYSCAWSLYIQR